MRATVENISEEVKANSMRPAWDRVTVVLFVAALWLPFLGTWFHWDPGGDRGENRALAAMPARPRNLSELENYSQQYLKWFDDHFGFRNELIGWNAKARYGGLGTTTNAMVIIGRDGWFFLRSDSDNAGFRGLNPFSPAELDQWQGIMQQRQRWLAKRGIVYLLMIPPDKQTIYPEYMPEYITRGTGATRLDQLVARLRGVGIKVVDVRAALLEAKASRQVFLKTDTHWSDAGALVGCREFLRAVGEALPQKTLPAVDESVLESTTLLGPGGDLAGLMGLKDVIREDRPVIIARGPRLVEEGGTPYGGTIIAGTGRADEVSMVMIRDSFANAVVPMMADRFGRGVYCSEDGFDSAVIAREHPDIVVTEIVERKLFLPPPADPPEVSDTK